MDRALLPCGGGELSVFGVEGELRGFGLRHRVAWYRADPGESTLDEVRPPSSLPLQRRRERNAALDAARAAGNAGGARRAQPAAPPRGATGAKTRRGQPLSAAPVCTR